MKAVIVANGEHAPGDERELAGAPRVYAADGGAEWLETLGVRPDGLVGDLDSTDPEVVASMAAAGTIVERHPVDKDASDLELALAAAAAAGADDIVILGAVGGDLDHLLANVLLLGGRAAGGGAMRLVSGTTTARLVIGPGQLDLAAPVGSRVSLLPVGPAAEGVTTSGLRWPLDGERLEAGSTRGLANEVHTAPARVALSRGRLLVIEIRGADGGPDR